MSLLFFMLEDYLAAIFFIGLGPGLEVLQTNVMSCRLIPQQAKNLLFSLCSVAPIALSKTAQAPQTIAPHSLIEYSLLTLAKVLKKSA